LPSDASLAVRSPWFERQKLDDDITLLYEPAVHPLMRCNVWHVKGRDRDLVVDFGFGVVSLTSAAGDLFAADMVGVATHFHSDHVGSFSEFDVRAIHHADAGRLPQSAGGSLVVADIPKDARKALTDAGYDMSCDLLVSALPRQDYDLAEFGIALAEPTWLLSEGDRIDLGDRSFEVLSLPGHTWGCIGLWEAATGILFSGDAIYDGPLLDFGPDSDIPTYLETMERLRTLAVTVVHAGHDPSFGRERLVALAETYMARHG
jgi:glyoxylase-like metal-dependent hydrolase (beta-lactamase superfamily II)